MISKKEQEVSLEELRRRGQPAPRIAKLDKSINVRCTEKFKHDLEDVSYGLGLKPGDFVRQTMDDIMSLLKQEASLKGGFDKVERGRFELRTQQK